MNHPSRSWLVTGSSRGFGRHLCELLLERGQRVIATARDPSALSALVERYPQRALALAMDVSDDSSVRNAVHAAERAFGVDVLVNNAGYVVVGAIEEVPLEQVQQAFDTNYFGAIRVIQAVLPAMRRRKSGHILNISAMGGMAASGGLGTYCATKFAMEALTEALAAEVAPFNIRVTSIQPGSFRTEAQSSAQVAPLLADYDATSGAMFRRFSTAMGTQPGDPRRAMQALISVVDMPDAPLRLPLGKDAVQRIRNKVRAIDAELDRWERVSALES